MGSFWTSDYQLETLGYHSSFLLGFRLPVGGSWLPFILPSGLQTTSWRLLATIHPSFWTSDYQLETLGYHSSFLLDFRLPVGDSRLPFILPSGLQTTSWRLSATIHPSFWTSDYQLRTLGYHSSFLLDFRLPVGDSWLPFILPSGLRTTS